MSGSSGEVKPPQTGLIDMGNISFYDEPGVLPPFNISDLANYPGSFSEIVLNVTWAELEPTENGPLDTSAIDNAITAVSAYNAANGTDVGIKLRVWGGYTAPVWAKTIDGPAITVTGAHTVDPGNTEPETIGRFWTADYIDAWTSFQNELAATYDSNPVIRGITNTAGASDTDEPFSQVHLSQMPELQAGGYTDAAEELTLRAGISDYSAWSTTPLDYSISLFRLESADNLAPDPNFSLAVLQEAENSSRIVQAGNHALNNPLPGWAAFVYAQIAADAALDPATVPASYQTDSTGMLGSSANWPGAISQGVAADAGNIELWDTPKQTGFTGQSPGSVAALATTLANGVAPVTGAPDDGAALGFVAPSLVTAAPGTTPFSGTNAILLASAVAPLSYTVTVTSEAGNTLTATENRQTLSGASVSFSGALAEVNTILASLTDTLRAGTDTLSITAGDGEGDIATQTVGVVASTGPLVPVIANQPTLMVATLLVDSLLALTSGSDTTVGGAAGAGDVDIAGQPGSAGTLLLAGVNSALSVAGNLDVGGTATFAGGSGVLLAALAPEAYSTASLAIGGTLTVWGEGTVRMTGALAAASIAIANNGVISGDGTLSASDGAIVNDGTIEAAADRTLGLQQFTVASTLVGSGQIAIDAGAELTLDSAVGAGQTIDFAAPDIEQLSEGPYSPTTLALAAPSGFAGTITGFSLADQLVLEGVDAAYVSYSSDLLQITPAGGGSPLALVLSGNLAGLQPLATVSGSGSAAATTISFVAPPNGEAPAVTAPASLAAIPGIAVAVPDVVLEVPFPAAPVTDPTIAVTLSAGAGALAVGSGVGDAAVSQTSPGLIMLTGTLDAVERSLQTLTYQSAGAGPDTIAITVSDYAGTSAPAEITVSEDGAGSVYAWSASGSGSFGDAADWTMDGSEARTAPGGADIAAFGPGAYTVTGDGAASEITDTGTLTLTGNVLAEGLAGTDAALSVDSGGALTLAGGAVLTAAGTATVAANGSGVLTLMGGALALTGPASTNSLVIGENPGAAGTVLDLEQITAAGTILVGEAGTGTLELVGVAASASNLSADIARDVGASGSVVVDGGEWTTSGWLTVGDAGDGAVLIDGAANGITGQATAADATIGHQAGSTGTVTLAGGDLLVANAVAPSSTLLIGGGGAGTLAVSDGGNVQVGVAQATIGDWQNTGTLILGNAPGGSGVLGISGNGSVEVDGNATIGQAGGAGTITIGRNAPDSGLFALTGTLAIGTTGSVALNGADALVRASAISIASGGTLSGAGTVSGDGGGNDTVQLVPITNDGDIAASGGALLVYGVVSGTGTLTAGSGSTLTLQAAVGPGQTLLFGTDAAVTLNDAGAFHATIAGFSPSDTIAIGSMPANPSGTAFLGANNVLTVTEGNETDYLRFDPGQDFSHDTFELSPDGSWGTAVTVVDPSGGPPPPVEESAAAVSAGLDQLNTSAQSGELGGIVLIDPEIPTVSLSALQLASDQDALRFIHGTFDLSVSDSGFLGASSAVQTLNAGATTGVDRITFPDGAMVYNDTDPAAQIFRLYQTVLDRAPDSPGLSGWTSLLQGGVSLQDIAAAFLASPEFQSKFGATSQDPASFVAQLYENGLHRAPDSSGLAYWTGALASGQMSEAQVAVGISESPESIGDSAGAIRAGIWVANPAAAAVTQLYYSALDRPPDLPGLEGWAGALASGALTLQQEAADFLDSSEFISKFGTLSNADFVTLMYHNALDRAPDPGGYAYWLQELDSGAMNRPGVLLGFSESPERLALAASVTNHGIVFT